MSQTSETSQRSNHAQAQPRDSRWSALESCEDLTETVEMDFDELSRVLAETVVLELIARELIVLDPDTSQMRTTLAAHLVGVLETTVGLTLEEVATSWSREITKTAFIAVVRSKPSDLLRILEEMLDPPNI